MVGRRPRRGAREKTNPRDLRATARPLGKNEPTVPIRPGRRDCADLEKRTHGTPGSLGRRDVVRAGDGARREKQTRLGSCRLTGVKRHTQEGADEGAGDPLDVMPPLEDGYVLI